MKKLKNFKLSVVLPEGRAIVYAQHYTWDEAKDLIAEKLEIQSSMVKGAKLSSDELDRIKSRKFKPNFSCNPSTVLKVFRRPKARDENEEEIKERKFRSFLTRVLQLFGKSWTLKEGHSNVLDLYNHLRAGILRNNLQDCETRGGITLLELLDSFRAGFEQPELKVVDEFDIYTVKTVAGEHDVKVKKVVVAGERTEFPLKLHTRTI